MIFEWMNDPAAWAGLATLIVLEIVLGIDNLVFIAILADKLIAGKDLENSAQTREADSARGRAG